MSEYDEDDNGMLLALEPGSYTHAIGIAMGYAEVMREEGVAQFLTLVFMDCEGSNVPILITPDSAVIEYLLSDKFQNDLREQVSELA